MHVLMQTDLPRKKKLPGKHSKRHDTHKAGASKKRHSRILTSPCQASRLTLSKRQTYEFLDIPALSFKANDFSFRVIPYAYPCVSRNLFITTEHLKGP